MQSIKFFIYLLFSWFISSTFCYRNMYDDYNYGKVIVKRQDEPKESVEFKILKKLERLRKTLPVGNPKSNIPVLDPFYIRNISVDYSIPNLRLNGMIKDISLSGLKYFYVDNLYIHVLPVQLDLDLTLPSLQLSSRNYNLRAKLSNIIPLFGKGQFVMKFNAKVKTFLKVSLKEKFIRIIDFGFEPFINDFNFKVTGILGSKFVSKIISQIVTAIFPKIFQMLQSMITNRLSAFGTEAAKHIFGDITVRELLQILDSNDDGLLNINDSF